MGDIIKWRNRSDYHLVLTYWIIDFYSIKKNNVLAFQLHNREILHLIYYH